MMDTAPQEKRFGPAVRAMRQRFGMSLDALSERSGVSRAMLSEVERGTKNPTIATASRIARGLEINLTELLEPAPAQEPFKIIRGGSRPRFTDAATGFVRELIAAPLLPSAPEVARHIIPAGGSSGELPPYASGTGKIVIVEESTLRLILGEQQIELTQGDAIAFRADVAHSFENTAPDECRYMLVIFSSQK
jgi:transcriptional regulator with XRE-family HTH domain